MADGDEGFEQTSMASFLGEPSSGTEEPERPKERKKSGAFAAKMMSAKARAAGKLKAAGASAKNKSKAIGSIGAKGKKAAQAKLSKTANAAKAARQALKGTSQKVRSERERERERERVFSIDAQADHFLQEEMDVHSNEREGTNQDMVAQDPLERAQEMLRKGEITKEEYESLAENIVSQDPLEKAKRMLERGEITQEEFESLAANMTQDPLDKAKRMLQRGEITQEDYEILASQLGGGTSWLSSMKEKVVEKKKKLSVSMQRKHFQQPSAPEAAPRCRRSICGRTHRRKLAIG